MHQNNAIFFLGLVGIEFIYINFIEHIEKVQWTHLMLIIGILHQSTFCLFCYCLGLIHFLDACTTFVDVQLNRLYNYYTAKRYLLKYFFRLSVQIIMDCFKNNSIAVTNFWNYYSIRSIKIYVVLNYFWVTFRPLARISKIAPYTYKYHES